MKAVGCILWCVLPLVAASQGAYTGCTVDESDKPVPFVAVYNSDSKTGALADALGIFSVEAHRGDTIKFRAVGFYTLAAAAMDSNMAKVVMKRDTVALREVVILDKPLRQAILELQLSGDEYIIIRELGPVQETAMVKYPVAKPYPGVYFTVLPPFVPTVAINIDEFIAEVKKRTPKRKKARILPAWD